jgi:DNA/RNA-binding domain of Phe-tRNA-synthetase-like protein
VEIKIELPDVKLGVVEADALRVAPADEHLSQLLEHICNHTVREFTVETLADAERTRSVRRMFRAWDIDPSKYRPSSEALLRRVVQGKGLYRVSNVVDIGNLISIETGWPLGCYDRAKIHPQIVFRQGTAGERYEGIGKRTWDLGGRPVLADPEGPFGSPISDSTRSMITGAARDIAVVMYAPSEAPDASIEVAMARFRDRLTEFAGARAVRSDICSAIGV